MGTSLTPGFWRQSAALLVIAMAVTFVLSAALDALVLRAQQRRAARWSSGRGTTARATAARTAPRRPEPTAVHTPVKS